MDSQFLVCNIIMRNAVMLLGSCHDLLPRAVCTARLTKWVALLKQLGQTVRTGSIRQVLHTSIILLLELSWLFTKCR